MGLRLKRSGILTALLQSRPRQPARDASLVAARLMPEGILKEERGLTCGVLPVFPVFEEHCRHEQSGGEQPRQHDETIDAFRPAGELPGPVEQQPQRLRQQCEHRQSEDEQSDFKA